MGSDAGSETGFSGMDSADVFSFALEEERIGTFGFESPSFPLGSPAAGVELLAFKGLVDDGSAEKFDVADSVGELKLELWSGFTVDDAESMVRIRI